MRRVDSEGELQGIRRRKRGGARPIPSQKPHLRRLSLEGLEDRTLMATSTLPSAITQSQAFVGNGITAAPNSSSPSVAIDPLDPTKLVAAWTTIDTANKLDGTNGQVTAYVQGAYSTNGGQSWITLPNSTVADVQTDFSVAAVTSGPQPNFSQTTDATVAFGRDQTAYLLTDTFSGTGGVLDLQKWNFSGSTPVSQTFARSASDQLSGFLTSQYLNPIYRWQGGDAAITPTLAVDNNLSTFTSGITQTDAFAGNVYVAWQTNDIAPTGVTVYNPYTIKLMSSSDNGQDFTFQAYLNGHGIPNSYDLPRLAISQGSSTVTGGQVTVVYDNAGPGSGTQAPGPNYDLVQTQRSDTGGTDLHGNSASNIPINNAILNGIASGVDQPVSTSIPITISNTDAKFISLSNLTVSISLLYPALNVTSATLMSPTGQTAVLWNTGSDDTGATVNMGSSLTGANLGASTLGPYIGTVLDSTAYRSLVADGTAPYTAHFRPVGSLQSTFRGLTAAQVTGTWTLLITVYRNQTITPPAPNPTLMGASLDLTSGNSDISNQSPVRVTTSFLNSATGSTYTDGVQGVPVLPDASIASDNSLGSYSAHKGRIYIALTNDNYVAVTGAYTTSTFIQLFYSDNGGTSWTSDGIVNDDNGITDGFSTGGYAIAGSATNYTNPALHFTALEANVRPKLDPQVAVDPDTGSLVVSFLDTRNDAAAVRVANYIAVSSDGGASFAPETYANSISNTTTGASYPVIDGITGNVVNLGPIPDNESAGNNDRETTFGFGQRQGLAVLNGRIIPVWSSNQNQGSVLLGAKVGLSIESAVVAFTSGPRVLSSTQGPVGEPGDTVNTTRAADGSPIANTIVLNFDRAVDPTTFPADGGTLGASPIQVFYNNPAGGTPIELSVLTVSPNTADTSFTVTFDPAGHGVGTYTYTLRPLVKDRIPYQAIVNNATTTITGNLLDQNGNGVPGQTTADAYSVPTSRNSLPLIVPGPHVSSTGVVGVNGTVSTGTDNLVNNDNANSINVTFDRTMQVSTFTPAQVLSVIGPAGRIDGPQIFNSTGTSKTYAYNGAYQLIPKAGTLTSTILIAGTGLKVSSLGVQVNITDPNDQSLQLTLVAPDGTMVPLVAAGTASGANFTNTTFSDAPPANGLTATVPLGAAPYSLTYQPASPLAALSGKVLDGTWKLLVTDSTTGTTPQGRLNAWSLNVTPQVPLGTGAQLNSTLVIPSFADNSFLISHLSVQLNISSTKDSDLQVNLISPKQTNGSQIIVPLVAALPVNGSNTNFSNTIFDDNGTIPIGSGVAPYSLTYRPSSPLSAFNGLSINGTWTLQIVNPNSDSSVTTLNSWSLIATPQLTVTPVNPISGGATTFTVGFPTQTLSGTYTVVLSPNILSVTANPANPTSGTPLDTNLNAGVDSLRGVSSGATLTERFPATAVPVSIPYATTTSGTTTNGVLNSQINVTDNFAIQGDVGTVSGLTVTLNISYYFDPDLSVTLTAPNGKTITLFMNIGKGATTANFNNTTLSDTITPTAPITAAAAPYFGTFNPVTPLSDFTTDLNNNQAFSGGLWTLTINNSGADPGSAIDTQHPPTLLGWSLSLQKPQPSTGLGEPVADQKSVSFRLFNINPSNPLANDTWTAVGPAGTTNSTNATNLGGPVSVTALDPSDPSGNTAYIGASSGGIWKTTNFLTTSAAGPTYVPLTDFGTNYTVNIGSIAIFARNNDPNQSIVFAGTGDGQATTANNGNASQGVGILRSTNGGASFSLLDSSTNVDASGNPLPENSPLRDHAFVGTTTYKIIVDPTALPGGGTIVYAALGGRNGGLWRSLDGGNHWQNLSAGVIPQVNGQNAAATDVLLDPVSVSPSTGNLDILYAAFQGVGVFISSNRGQALTELFGNVGADNLIQNSVHVPGTPLTVNDANTPNGNFGRIVLAKPALTNNTAENIQYQDWLYVAVENTNGTFRGLYITKDRGENWTLAQIASDPTPAAVNAVTQALPTNDNTQTNNYDVTAGKTGTTHNGNSAFSMAIDPSNPNIVYLGGTQDYQTSGLIRVDLTGIYDAHAYVPFANDRNDGGKLTIDSTGRTNYDSTALRLPGYEGTSPGFETGVDYTNLRHNPTNLFDTSSTLFVFNSSTFTNDGTGVKWTPIDQEFGDPLDGSTNIHQMFTIVDPLTGLTRLIVSDDQGVFTGVYNANGTLNASGIGTAVTVTGSRNGNLQDEEIYYSAAQPSALAAQTAGALFYGSGIGMTDVQSAYNLLSTGNLTWNVVGTSYGDLQGAIQSNDRGGTGIATDATGGVTSTNPGGNPSLYEYDVPFLGGDTTNFFRLNNNGRTTGLVNNFAAEFPANNVLSNGNGVTQLGNFTVNPINGSQILISSNLGNVYETTNQGLQWLQIGAGQAVGSGTADFDGTYAPALAYGAPDPNAPNGIGNLNNFIYVGTVGGHIYVTQNGGGPWTSISSGLDGSSVVAIYTNPNRGSHEAYAVTLKGVYYMANSLASGASWVNITGNLTQIQHNPFGNSALAENAILNYGNGQLGGFRSIVADYRYAVPDPVIPNTTYPVLYVSGYGGVFRSLDNGQTWTAFPNTSFDSAPVDGGYLPNVDVTSLQLNLGAINPATGHPTQVTGDPEVLLASTLGRGDFAIRLAPDVFPTTIHFDATLPSPGGSDSGSSATDQITNVLTPYIDGISEISNFGNTVTITLTDASNGHVIGTGTTDPFGHFSIQLVNNGSDPTFFQTSATLNDKVVGIQATDSSGASGNVTDFRYTLLTNVPATPSRPTLEARYDTGRSNSDDITNIEVPAPTPGATPIFVAPVFDVTTMAPPAGLPTGAIVQLLRATNPNGPFTVVMTSTATGQPIMLADTSLQALAQAGTLNGIYYYESDQFDVAGNLSAKSGVLAVTVNTTTPPTLAPPTLELSSNSGLVKNQLITNVTHPVFDATGLLANEQLLLYRSTGGAAPILVGTAAVGVSSVADGTGATPDGVYLYQVVQQDIAGNVSNYSQAIAVTINTTTPASPTINLVTSDDSGLPLHPNVTNVRTPHLSGNAQYNAGTNFPLDILLVTNGNNASGTVVASTLPSANGTYLAQITTPLADGTYTLVARTTNLAGTFSYSSPLIITIKGTGPQIVPTLSILPVDDTGIKGDGVTANHNPRFTGKTDKGAIVTLYALINGVLSGPQATTTASTLDGSFTFKLPFNLTNGSTQLIARATDIANNAGPVSAPLTVRIITVAGDYVGTGSAQLTVFDPLSETYYVRNTGSAQVDSTPGRDVPVQYDFNGDGATDLTAYRYNTAEYFGFVTNNTTIDAQYGAGGASLPVSGTYGSTGTFIYGTYLTSTGTWILTLPQANGLTVNFGAPKVDVPTPAAFDGSGVTEIAFFRPTTVQSNDADSFGVYGPNGPYLVSFTNPAATQVHFTYKAGDIPAPADYDGIGKDEFAIYRPSTGQFFILSTPNVASPATWTLRTVTLNLPGGPNASDEPASQDYDGNGKADPTVYRPSNSTFYMIHSSTGIQENIQFGGPNQFIAAAGPLLYRLTALRGQYASNGGIVSSPGGGGTIGANSIGGLHTLSIASASNSSTSSSTPVPTLIALASPIAVTLPAVSVSQAPSKSQVTIGASTPKAFVPVTAPSQVEVTAKTHLAKTTKAKKAPTHSTVDAKPQAVESKPVTHHAKLVAVPVKYRSVSDRSLQSVVLAKKGRHQG